MERIVRLEVKRPVLRGSTSVVERTGICHIERVDGGFVINWAGKLPVFVPDSNVTEATFERVSPPKAEGDKPEKPKGWRIVDKSEFKALLEAAAKQAAPKPKKKPRKK